MKKETAVAAIIVFAMVGFFGGWFVGGLNPEAENGEGVEHASAPGHYDSSILPIGESPTLGSADAPATVVFFVDFASRSAVRAAADIEEALADDNIDGDDVRLVVKFLPGGDEGRTAAAAAIFAAEHGSFEGVYDLLRENQDSLDEDTINTLLEGAGLDPEEFDASSYSALIDADVNLARSLGQRRAPAVFVNGHALTGRDLNANQIRTQVLGEVASVDDLLESGVSAGTVYGLRVRENADPTLLVASNDRRRGGNDRDSEERERPSRAAAPDAQAPRRADAQPPSGEVERLRVPVGDSYFKGPADALVTIIEFSDFHCPFCSRVGPTLAQIHEQYGDDVRVAFKHNPLPMHPNAPLASATTLAAGAQGKFWEMHDMVFENQRRQTREDMESFAEELGLDMGEFRAFLDGDEGAAQIEADTALARQVGARGTPHFFINGRRLRGAQPVTAFQEVIDSEIALANQLIADGTTDRAGVYEHLMEGASEQAAEAAPTPSQPEQPAVVEPPPIGDSAARGPEDAEVTIFIFSEFQCPYCGRAQPTMRQIEETYGDQVRFVFKSFPLPFHDNAHLASQAALAAGEQGKFWEYHDILFENQRALSRPDLERYAQELGLEMGQFREALDSGRFSDQVDQEAAEGRRVGVSGTPTFVVNGERVVGAVPFSRFQPIIDRALAD